MGAVRWTMRAADDLEAIKDFIARDSQLQGIRTAKGISRAIDNLEMFPRMGRIVPEFEREDLRELLYKSYRIIYQFDHEAAIILRIVHGSRDLLHLAQAEPWDQIQ